METLILHQACTVCRNTRGEINLHAIHATVDEQGELVSAEPGTSECTHRNDARNRADDTPVLQAEIDRIAQARADRQIGQGSLPAQDDDFDDLDFAQWVSDNEARGRHEGWL